MLKWKERYLYLNVPNIPSLNKLKEKYNHDYLIKLNYNESNYGPTPIVLNHYFKLENPHTYPDYNSQKLINRLAILFKLKPENFWISNGSDAILDAIPALFSSTKKVENIIIPDLTYGRIEQTSIVRGVKLKKIPLKNGYINLDKTLKSIDTKTSIIYIVNPNMPTGTSYTYDELNNFISKVPSNILVVIDEAYIEFNIGVRNSFKFDHKLIKNYDNVLITRTFSKLFALAGHRIGYMVASEHIVDLFKRAIQIFPVSALSSQVAIKAISDIPYYENICKLNRIEKEKFYKFFDKHKIQHYKTSGNFIYINTKNTKWTNKELRLFLLAKHKILIRNIRKIGLRITIGTKKENVLVRNAIEDFLNEK